MSWIDVVNGDTANDFDDAPDGARLLDQVEAMLARFVAFPSDEARIAVTLWVAHTHALTAFECTPRLAFLSPAA